MLKPIPEISKPSQPLMLKDHALQAVKEAIITHQLEPGQLYSESNLAEVLNVSRTPVREALASLSTMGFVTIARGRGFQINTWTKDTINEIYLFRRMLELTIVRIATPLLNEEAITKLEVIHDGEKKAIISSDFRAHQLADRAIHLFLAAQTKNRYLYASLENMRDLIEWIGYKVIKTQPIIQERYSHHHMELIEALRQQDVAAAEAIMEQHILLGRMAPLKTMDELEKG